MTYTKTVSTIITFGLHYLDFHIWNFVFLLKAVNWISLKINKSQLIAVGGADIQGTIYFVVF